MVRASTDLTPARSVGFALLGALAILALGCGSPTDPFSSGPAHATVTGRVTAASGLPVAATTVEIACAGGGPAVKVTTDSAGRYLANLTSGPDPFGGPTGDLACRLAEPTTTSPRAETDTSLAFARGPLLVVQQTVNLHEF